MLNRSFFFEQVRSLFGGKLTQAQVKGMSAILDEWAASGLKDDRWLAYMLATVFHETDQKMQPIEEYGKGRKYDYGKRLTMKRKPYTDTSAIFYGRGFAMITWYENYDKLGKRLNIDLVHNPDLALTLPVATKILFIGMIEGLFTGKKLSQYFNETTENWAQARKIINGLDRAEAIAGYAKRFYAALSHK